MARYTPETGYKEAQKRIRKAMEKTAVSLNLNRLGLTAVPSEITQLTTLKSLYLNSNQLTVVPSEITQLTTLQSLDLGSNQLTSIPSRIGRLTALQSLNLWNNRLTAVPPEITRLTALKSLYLNSNHLATIPAEITQLTALKTLSLSANQLTAVPAEITQLTALQSLSLNRNRLMTAPPEITQLTALQSLNLGANQLTAIPPQIGQLTALQTLDLGANQLTAIPSQIGQLTALQTLDLSVNRLTAVPLEITQLTALQTLDLSINQLTAVPPGIKQLVNLQKLWIYSNQLTILPKWLVEMPQLERLQIQQNPITQPPPELLGDALTTSTSENTHVNLEAVRRYYAQLEKEGEAYFYEAKLLLIGEGGAGKTSLARKLITPYQDLPPANESTEGIEVKPWEFPVPASLQPPNLPIANLPTTYTANIWDFGGQSIYKATHQFFFSKRSVYILLSDTRRDETDFYDWLRMQEAFGEDSPILLLQNKNRTHGSQYAIENLPYLRDHFSNLQENIELDLKNIPDKEPIAWEDLLRYLKRHLMGLSHISKPIPATWVAVRHALNATEHNSISRRTYFTLCIKHGITDKADALQLSDYLHNIGDLLHFQDDSTLAAIVILNPTWALDAVYRVLDNETIINNWGRFSNQRLYDLWNEVEYDGHHHQLLALMQHFQLCYELPNQRNQFIAPQLLKVAAPANSWDAQEDAVIIEMLQIRYQYARFMPRGILSRAIVSLHENIEYDNGHPLIWRSGALLSNGEARAKLLELRGENEIRIYVTGNNKRDLLMRIVTVLDKLHESFSKKLNYKKLVPCRCDRCLQIQNDRDNKNPIHFFELDYLRKRLASPKQHKHFVDCGYEPFDDVHVRDLIDDTILRLDRRGGDTHTHYHYGDDIRMGNITNAHGVAIGRESNTTIQS